MLANRRLRGRKDCKPRQSRGRKKSLSNTREYCRSAVVHTPVVPAADHPWRKLFYKERLKKSAA
jgi:hypothetical protein